jgi:hypothetical protein
MVAEAGIWQLAHELPGPHFILSRQSLCGINAIDAVAEAGSVGIRKLSSITYQGTSK